MRYKIFPVLLIALLAFSCKKKKIVEPEAPQILQHGMLVLKRRTVPAE
jgi:hypothetical protein